MVATGNSVSAGQLLCGGLFSTDSLSNWCAAVALAHALQENGTLKEQLLRVQLATSIGNPPVSLLQQCTNILSQVLHGCPLRLWGQAQGHPWAGHGIVGTQLAANLTFPSCYSLMLPLLRWCQSIQVLALSIKPSLTGRILTHVFC